MRLSILGTAAVATAALLALAAPALAQDDTAKRVAELERELANLKKLVLAKETPAAGSGDPAAAGPVQTYRSVGGVDKPLLTAFVGGYFSIEYRDEENRDSEFDNHRLVLQLFSQVSDYIVFDTEIEIEGGGADVPFLSGNEILVEYAELRLSPFGADEGLLSDLVNVKAGLILVPFGKFNLRHDDPFNDLVDRPFIRRVTPVAFDQPGVGLYGALPAGLVSFSYDVALIQGYQDNFTNNGGARDARQSFRSDNNNTKDVVGRFGLALFPGGGVTLDLGLSGYAGKPDAQEERPIRGFALDLEFRTPSLGTAGPLALGPLELLAEYHELSIHRKATDPPAATNGFTHGLNAYYVQINWHFFPTALRGGFFGDESWFTLVFRYEENDLNDRVHGSAQRDDRHAYTFGFNLRFTEKTVLKLGWQQEHSSIANPDTDRLEKFTMAFATFF